MNIHSPGEMHQTKPRLGDELADRRARILDAAERSFCRSGFHRTTMQDVAAGAGMSTGNLYRYVPSKDALVAGLCERDRLNLGREFSELGTTSAISWLPFAPSAGSISKRPTRPRPSSASRSGLRQPATRSLPPSRPSSTTPLKS